MAKNNRKNNKKPTLHSKKFRLAEMRRQQLAVEATHKQLQALDPNQYYIETDPEKNLKGLTDQINTGVCKGTGKLENLLHNTDLNYKRPELEPKLFVMVFNNPQRGEDNRSLVYFNLVKINNVYYYRDHSNHMKQQWELNNKFTNVDPDYIRPLYVIDITPEYVIEDNIQTASFNNNVEVEGEHISLQPYFNHNKIVLHARREWHCQEYYDIPIPPPTPTHPPRTMTTPPKLRPLAKASPRRTPTPTPSPLRPLAKPTRR